MLKRKNPYKQKISIYPTETDVSEVLSLGNKKKSN